MMLDYETSTDQYLTYRNSDPRILKRIQFHLGEKNKILNVGAGTGSYEPDGCDVISIEPSIEMIKKRNNPNAGVIKGIAENIEEITLGPGRNQRVSFSVVKDAAGFYPVSIEHLSGRFVVEMDWKE